MTKKPRRVAPTMNNGPVPANVPPNIEYDPSDPPVIYECSQHTSHHPDCNRECESFVATESQVTLMNEAREWARLGMNFFGVPQAYANQIPIAGINVELFDLELKFEVLRDLIVEHLVEIDPDELEDKFRLHKIERMQEIRFANQDNIRKARLRNAIGVAKPPLLGPDGQPL